MRWNCLIMVGFFVGLLLGMGCGDDDGPSDGAVADGAIAPSDGSVDDATSDGGPLTDSDPGDDAGSGDAASGDAGTSDGGPVADSGPVDTGPAGACSTEVFCDEPTVCFFAIDQACGADGASGTCEVPPEVCPDLYDPVCGCDGVTYGNECEARAATASIAARGECEVSICGGLLGTRCGAGEFCNYSPDAMCGAADQTGECVTVPDACIEIFDPVCGCDGMTYSNGCFANAAGVSVASRGECGAGAACGTRGARPCPEAEFCRFTIGAICGAVDAGGTCSVRPEVCPAVFDPVCGCDGVTYSNECVANAAGMSAASSGEC